ncbi:transporter substrate-binding domain-containing protein [Legionella nagasakiensis]|uniref:transporter substrate-binding domain-containing protein n=1 Tax=Legionella nagasakiensis TaxID=535290 RepID=UPI001055C8EE|nr:transporter substrate-binding domain-containing protein [Legionella nagasakiensis]
MKILVILLFPFLMCSKLFAEQLIVATAPFDPPMEMQASNNGVFVGFEIDIVDEVCRRINASCIYKAMSFNDIMIAVQAGTVDLGINGFFITQARLKYFLFSLPYLQTKAQLFTNADSNINSNNLNTGQRIGVEKGTIFQNLLLEKYNNVNVITYTEQQDMLHDLENHKIDVIMFDYIDASYWVDNNPENFKYVGAPISIGMGYGILANINSIQLINRINNALIDMENDGTYLSIYNRYF